MVRCLRRPRDKNTEASAPGFWPRILFSIWFFVSSFVFKRFILFEKSLFFGKDRHLSWNVHSRSEVFNIPFKILERSNDTSYNKIYKLYV